MQFEGDSCFASGIRGICENRSLPRHFLTILAEFILFNSPRANFDACNKLTRGLALDFRRELCKSFLLRMYKI